MAKSYSSEPDMQVDPSKTYHATISTNHGDMKLKLNAAEAPKTVNNFVSLARDGFYDGVVFHRIIEGFMIQGGDPDGNGTGGPGYKFADEQGGLDLKHDKPGKLSMANAGPNTNGSQFFITLAPTPHLNGKHAVFGEVVEGQDVLEKIGGVDVDVRDKPKDDVTMQKVTITEE